MQFSDIPRNPDKRTLRQFAGLWLIIFGAVALSQYFRSGNPTTAVVVAAVALGVSLPGLLFPQLLKPVFVGWMMLVFPIGWLVSHILLAAIFLGIFTPFGWVLRLTGHDPLRLKKPVTTSYWQARPMQTDASRYLRQY